MRENNFLFGFFETRSTIPTSSLRFTLVPFLLSFLYNHVLHIKTLFTSFILYKVENLLELKMALQDEKGINPFE